MDGPSTPGVDPQPIPPQPPISPQPEIPRPRKKARLVFGCIGIFLGLAIASLRAWMWSYGVVTAEASGYAMGVALVPALIAYAIAGRKKVRNFGRFGMWFAATSAIFLAIGSVRPVSMKQHVADLMREAAGTKAIERGGAPMDNLVRQMMQGVLEDRKNLERETAPFAAELGKLYSVGTFSGKAEMQASIDAVRGIAAADRRYSQTLQGIPDRIEAMVNASSLSESDKRDFMAGVRKSYGNQKTLQIRREAMDVEQQWEDTTVALYEFCMTNAARIRRHGDRLAIGNEQVRLGFNQRLEKALSLRKELRKRNDELEAAQRAALQASGVTMKDLGLEDISQPGRK